MTGTGSFLVLFLLTASSEDAGVATVSDQAATIGTTIPSVSGQASPVNYVGQTPDGETADDKNPSLLQEMLQEQNQVPKSNPVPKPQQRENPFKEEESKPGEAIAEPLRRLPSVQATPPMAPSTIPGSTAPTVPSYSPPSNTALPGEVSCGPYGGATIDSCISNGCQADVANRAPLSLRDWFSGIEYEGWVDQGVTINTNSPRNRSNFPVGFNNRSNDYQLNQLYLRLLREVNTQCDQWDVGGTIDFLYGTDSIYTSARGLEVDRNFGTKWNAQQLGLALPQCYMELFAPWGEEGFTMKLGHFYANLGYETVTAPDNFFYSHSLALLYGEPLTETGFLAEKKFESFKIQAGATRGWDNWEDNNNNWSFLGGISWIEDDGCSSLGFTVQSGPEQNEPPENINVRNVFSLVFQQKFGERCQYVIQYDYGQEDRNDILPFPATKWIGLDQYLFYTISEQWKAGLRFEWFRDQDGVRVPGVRQGADYYDLTAGLNWTPTCRIAVRPELRYDWTGTPNFTPYNDASRSYQLLLDCDVIVQF